MKIYEIISESRLTEAPGSPVVTEFINGMLKGMAWTLGRGPRTKAAEELARVWSAEMIAAGKPTVKFPAAGSMAEGAALRAEQILTAARMDAALAADGAVVEEGYNVAKKIFLQAENKGLLKDVAQGARNVSNAVGKVTNFVAWNGKWITRILLAWEATQPWQEYTAAIEKAEAETKTNPPTLTEDEFKKLARQEWIIMMGKLAVIIPTVGGYAAGKVGMKVFQATFLRRLRNTGPWTATLQNLVKTATPAALLAFHSYLTNAERGSIFFAYWLTSAGGTKLGTAVENIIEWGGKAGEFMDQATTLLSVPDTAGGSAPSTSNSTPQPQSQSGQRTPPAGGRTVDGATVTGNWN